MTNTNSKKPIVCRRRKVARRPRAQIEAQHCAVQHSVIIREPSPASEPEIAQKRATKTDLLLALLRREQGASLPQLVEATGWLAHTTRAALTGLRKKGHVVISDKVDGLRVYRIASDGEVA